MSVLITILTIIAAVLLIVIVLIQNPKGGGLSSEFGSAHKLGGVRKTTDALEKGTWFLAIAIMVLSLVAPTNSTTVVNQNNVDSDTEIKTQQNNTLPIEDLTGGNNGE